MDIDDFLRRVTAEPPRTISRDVRIYSSDEIARLRGRRLDEIRTLPSKTERRTFEYRHLLGEPATESDIETWAQSHVEYPLPDDLRALVRRVDGIHLWAESTSGRAYQGLAPIAEWESVRTKMYGPSARPDRFLDRFVALTYHTDHGANVVLDPASGGYFIMDPAGPSTDIPNGSGVPDLLEWLWRERLDPSH